MQKPPASPRPRVFLSTVSREFKTLRADIAKVVRHLGYDPVSMDDWSAAHGELRAWLRAQLESCDGIIHLAGLAYGAEPNDHDPAAHGLPSDTPRYSYTQYEWHYAQAIGLKSWLILPGPHCTRDTPPDQLDLPEDPAHPDPAAYQNERRQWQAQHIARLKAANHIHHHPADDRDLHRLLDTLHDHAAEMRERFGQWQGFVTDYLMRMEGKVDRVQRDTRHLRKAAVLGLAALLLVAGGISLVWRQARQTGDDIAETRKEISEIKDIHAKERKFMALILGKANERLKDWESMTPAQRFDLALDEIAADQKIPARELRDMLDLYVARVEADPDAQAEDKFYVLMRRQAFGEAATLARAEAGSAEQRMRQHAARKEAAQALASQAAAQEEEERRHAVDFYSKEGSASYAAIKYEEALTAYQKAAALVDKEADPVAWAKAQGWVAFILDKLARYAEAEPLMREVLRLREQHLGPEAFGTAAAFNDLATLLMATNRPTEAEPLMRRALEIDETSLGPEHPSVAINLNNLAQLLQDTNRLVEAEPLMKRVVSIFETAYGPEHPDVAIPLNNLAQLLQATNRLAEAEPLMRRALEIDEGSLGPEHPHVARDLNNLAQLLKAKNRLAEAEPLMRRALAIDEASYGPEHPDVAIRLNNLAQLLQDTNRLAEAEPLMERVVSIFEKAYGPDHPQVAIGLNNVAALLQATNRLAEAEPLYRRALAINETKYGPEHHEVANSLNNLATVFQATNRLAESELLMRRVVRNFCLFQARTGHAHPQRETVIRNYVLLLLDMKVPEPEIIRRVEELEAEAREAAAGGQ